MPEADDRIRAALQELGEHVPVDDTAEVSRRAMDGGRAEAPPQRWFVAAAAALVLVALAVGALALTSGGDDRDDVQVTEEPPPIEDGPELLWTREVVTSSGSFPPSDGRLLAADGERVYAATGFGASHGTDPDGRVTGMDRETGETLWDRSAPDPVFLGGLSSGELLLLQSAVVQGVDAAAGEDRWHLDLAERGLDGYRPTVADTSAEPIVVGLSATMDGDTRPPVVLGLDREGETLWQTALDEGTDLQWGPPARDGDSVVMLSTLAHPGSAPGNVAHAIDTSDGSILWSVDLGGGQGFGEEGAVVADGLVHLPGQDALVTVDLSSGAPVWSVDAFYPRVVATGDELWTSDRHSWRLLAARTGEILDDGPVDGAGVLYLDAVAGGVLVSSRDGGALIDSATREVAWEISWPGPLMERPLVTGDLLIVATDAGIAPGDVTAYRIPGTPAPVPGTTAPPETTEPESVDIDAVVAVDPVEIERDLLLFGENGIEWLEDGERRQVWSEPVDRAFHDDEGGVVFQDRDGGAIRWLPAIGVAPETLVAVDEPDTDTLWLHAVVPLSGEGGPEPTVLYTHREDDENQTQRLHAWRPRGAGYAGPIAQTGAIESGLDAVALSSEGLLVSTCHLQCTISWAERYSDPSIEPLRPADWISGLAAHDRVLGFVHYRKHDDARGTWVDPALLLIGLGGETQREVTLPEPVHWSEAELDLSGDGRAALVWSRPYGPFEGSAAIYVDRLDTDEPRVRILDGVEGASFP